MSALIRALPSLGHLSAILYMLYLFSTVKTCTGVCYWSLVSFLVVFDFNDIHLYCILHPGKRDTAQIKVYVTSPPTQKCSRASDEYCTQTLRVLRDVLISFCALHRKSELTIGGC